MEHQQHRSKKPGCRGWSKGLTVVACLCAVDLCISLVQITVWKMPAWSFFFPLTPYTFYVLVVVLGLVLSTVCALLRKPMPFVACVLVVAFFNIVVSATFNVRLALFTSDLVHSHFFIINTLYVVFYFIVGGYIFSRISRRCLLYFCLFLALVVSAICVWLLRYVQRLDPIPYG